MRKTPLIVGNWKMHCLKSESLELARVIAEASSGFDTEMVICPPTIWLDSVATILQKSQLSLGAQDCHMAQFGAHTGDIAAAMLKDVGCRYVLVGHSERRQNHAETDAMIKAKAESAITAGLCPIICIGETESQRAEGATFAVISSQIDGAIPMVATAENCVIAYEPIWAIGTGNTATPDDAQDVHDHIRTYLQTQLHENDALAMRILYGGSMKPENAADLLSQPDIDGGLVGGASLKAADFIKIVSSAG